MAGVKSRSGGHNRQSVAVHKLRGTYRRDRHAKGSGPTTTPATVLMPAGLSTGAQATWGELAPICIALGTLTLADARAFATLCELQATLQLVVTHKAARVGDGLLAALRCERQTASVLRGYYGLFGLTPMDRTRLPIPEPDDGEFSEFDSPLEKFRPKRWPLGPAAIDGKKDVLK